MKAKLRDDRKEATRAHEIWAMDFVHDQLATGPKLRILTIVDLYSRFSTAIDPRLSYRGEDVVTTLERLLRVLSQIMGRFSRLGGFLGFQCRGGPRTGWRQLEGGVD